MTVTPITPGERENGASASPSGHSRAEPSGLGPTAECPSRGPMERVRHIKRSTEYDVLGEAEAQVSYDRIGAAHRVVRPLWDENRLTVYRCVSTGKLWVRFTDEFRDGRFETILIPAFAAAHPSGGWRPIETAPKDGTKIQGYGPHDTDGWYIDTIHCWRGNWTIKWMHGFGEPTHWRPLPDPPGASCDGSAEGGETGGLDPKGNSAVGEAETPQATPSSLPSLPNPPKGQEETPCFILPGGEAGLREALIAFLEDRYWQKPGLMADEADALLAGPLAQLQSDRARLEAENERLRAELANRPPPHSPAFTCPKCGTQRGWFPACMQDGCPLLGLEGEVISHAE